MVELAYSDKQFLVLYEDNQRQSFIRVYNTKDALDWGKKEGSPKCVAQIKGPKDHTINDAKFGPLDQSIYYATDKGRILKWNFDNEGVSLAKDVNRNEIFTIKFSRDFTMLFTCSKDGTCKLLHPETFEEIRSFNNISPCRDVTLSPLFDASEN
jgi:WD40 repeat protein